MTVVTEVAIDPPFRDVVGVYGGEVRQTPDGQRYLVLARFPLGPGWSPTVTQLAVRITGYPEAALDGFFVPGQVRLASGAQPTNASLTALFGADLWWAFSYHARLWRPGRHDIRSFLGLVRQRFAEAR